MKVLVTGVSGQLGFDIFSQLKSKGIECVGTKPQDFDITNEDEVFEYINKISPTVVVHCAAYTAVDNAQDDEDLCRLINVNGSENIAKACAKLDAK
ncbi:MAG: sugar nucleotide-binding protein, partial [Acutalibacteraceae bacterium]